MMCTPKVRLKDFLSMHTKHGMKEKLRYIQMLNDGYTVDYIHSKLGINHPTFCPGGHIFRPTEKAFF